ncbi:MAG TPA: hypothetical protein VFN76_01565 [Candidatus Limnocylindria bacterium]|nr:hypothetical protein [Candidatus Limnocylindria bacterium]
MDFSKLGQNEKLATYGAIAAIVGAVLAAAGTFGFGVGWLGLLLALAMLAIVFLPQLSPGTNLPGSKGSLMLVVGGIAAVFAVLGLLSGFGLLGLLSFSPLFVIGWLLNVIGGLMMGWAGWQEFQAEGGKFQLGSSTASADRATTGDAPSQAAASAPPPPAPAATPEAPADTTADTTMPDAADEERRSDF